MRSARARVKSTRRCAMQPTYIIRNQSTARARAHCAFFGRAARQQHFGLARALHLPRRGCALISLRALFMSSYSRRRFVVTIQTLSYRARSVRQSIERRAFAPAHHSHLKRGIIYMHKASSPSTHARGPHMCVYVYLLCSCACVIERAFTA